MEFGPDANEIVNEIFNRGGPESNERDLGERGMFLEFLGEFWSSYSDIIIFTMTIYIIPYDTIYVNTNLLTKSSLKHKILPSTPINIKIILQIKTNLFPRSLKMLDISLPGQ